MAPAERSWAKEAARDLDETAFTPILRRLLYRTTGIMSVAFVDPQGECVDYCSSLDPFDTKVSGAQMLVTMSQVAERMQCLDAGQSILLTVHGTVRDLLARRVSDEYLLVAVLKPRALTTRMMGGIEHAVTELRREAMIEVPSWESVQDSVRVELRSAVGWPYAPAAYFDEEGERIGIAMVMGRWIEGDERGRSPGEQDTVSPHRMRRLCFRVQTDAGEELTLVHDRSVDRWERSYDSH